MRNNKSSNGIPIEVDQVVIYSTGTELCKCLVKKITTQGKGKWERVHRVHLESIQHPHDFYEVGHKFVAKAAIRLWVLDETKDEALEKMMET